MFSFPFCIFFCLSHIILSSLLFSTPYSPFSPSASIFFLFPLSLPSGIQVVFSLVRKTCFVFSLWETLDYHRNHWHLAYLLIGMTTKTNHKSKFRLNLRFKKIATNDLRRQKIEGREGLVPLLCDFLVYVFSLLQWLFVVCLKAQFLA